MTLIKQWGITLLGCALLAITGCGQMGDLSLPVPAAEEDQSDEENER